MISEKKKRFEIDLDLETTATHSTLPQMLEEIVAVMCDKYCKYPEALKDEEQLMQHCEHCPMRFLVGGGDGRN